MDNIEIANIFSKIADILEIKGENIFRVRAYRTAAQNITGLSRQISDIYSEDPESIGRIPGIGKDLKNKIIEMIETSTLKYFDELKTQLPDGFIDMLNISGLGPKKLKKLYEKLNIENVDDLEKACKEGKVSMVEGMGQRSQEKILKELDHFREKQGRMLLPEANDIADEIINYLSKDGNFLKIEKAGSLRRGKETIGDIDVLATVKDNEKAMEYFTGYPEKDRTVLRGKTKTSLFLKTGMQVDLRVVEKKNFGAALQYFTGSQTHNVKIRHIAKTKGYKVNEYGVFSINKSGKDKFVCGKTEKEVYEILGMSYIPPELRESQGEIESAQKHDLPEKLIRITDIKGDLHIHSNATDGRSSIEENIKAAKEKGYEYCAITDHSKLIKISGGMNEKQLLKHVDNIRKIAKKIKGIKVLAGVEVDILDDGSLDLEDYALKELDIVIAAVHSKFSLEKNDQTDRILKALDNKYVNILAHPSGRLITRRRPLDIDLEKIFKKAVSNKCFLEINTHGDRIDLNAANARRAKEMGAEFAINTDSHDVKQMDLMIYGVITARRGWIEKQDVLNTYSYDKLLKALKRS